MPPAQRASTGSPQGLGTACRLCATGAIPASCSHGAVTCALPPGTTAGSARRSGMAVTPLTLQVKVKKHIQLILERLLHTVNRRVIVLDRENTLRVSTTTAASRCAGHRGCTASHSCLWAMQEMQKASLI